MAKKNDQKNVNNSKFSRAKISSDFNTISNNEGTIELNKKQKVELILKKKINIKCKNKHQKEFIENIENNEITICFGSAGVGKSYLSVAEAIRMLQDNTNFYDRIYIITPVVESEEKLGSLPGNVDEKLAPYLFSTYYLIDKIIGKPAREILVEKEIIVPIALAYLRGVNLDNCILIAEEMQNSTISSFKTLLTRIGENCKMIISGDIDQIDRFRDKNQSGLFDSLNRFTYTDENGQIKSKVDGLNIFQFAPEDIVRNKIISNILDKY